jgi:hypothetical protein
MDAALNILQKEQRTKYMTVMSENGCEVVQGSDRREMANYFERDSKI